MYFITNNNKCEVRFRRSKSANKGSLSCNFVHWNNILKQLQITEPSRGHAACLLSSFLYNVYTLYTHISITIPKQPRIISNPSMHGSRLGPYPVKIHNSCGRLASSRYNLIASYLLHKILMQFQLYTTTRLTLLWETVYWIHQ